MYTVILFVSCLLVVFAITAPPPYEFQWETVWKNYTINQSVDHFDFQNHNTFPQKYSIRDEHYVEGGPIFFYTGGEFNTGLHWRAGLALDLAPEFGALVVAAEHRYYGESLPFGDASWNEDNIGYLSIAQALTDYSLLISHLQGKYNTTQTITFGGSYGALLSAWMRLRFPHLVTGAIASSGPLNFFAETTARLSAVSETYNATEGCGEAIRTAFQTYYNTSRNETLRGAIKDGLNLCYHVENDTMAQALLDYMTLGLNSISQLGYPYPLFVELAWPVHNVCDAFLSQGMDSAMKYTLGLWYNSTKAPPRPCFDFLNINVQNITSIRESSWDYQTCTEFWMAFGANGETDIFFNNPFNYTEVFEYCAKKYDIRMPSLEWTMQQFGGPSVPKKSNLLFVNGGNDPVRALAPVGNVTKLLIPNVGQSLDLFPISWMGNQTLQDLLDVREQEEQHIRAWLSSTEDLVCEGGVCGPRAQ